MRRLAPTALLVFVTLSAWAELPPQTDTRSDSTVEHEHAEWLNHVMRQIAAIKPGMTRKYLLAIFQKDGGLSPRQHGRYVYRQCPNIKVDVAFSFVNEPADNSRFPSADDKIVKISRPYLEYPFND
jgi:hypothetical protein